MWGNTSNLSEIMVNQPEVIFQELRPAGGPTECLICGDNAAGLHYGALSCDGCKGFFRRSVVDSQVYKCRLERNCLITKEIRNSCRYCRLKKCFKAGMKIENVRTENFKTDHRRKGNRDINTSEEISLKILLQVDKKCKGNESAFPILTKPDTNSKTKAADINDLYQSLNERTQHLFEWAKYISAYCKLLVDDQKRLIASSFGELLIIDLIRRSINLNGFLMLNNGSIIELSGKDFKSENTDENSTMTEEQKFGFEISNSLIRPLKEIQTNDEELVMMKAIIFFDPHADGLENRQHVEKLQGTMQEKLEDYCFERRKETGNRYGRLPKLLTMLRTLQSTAQAIVHQIRIDQLTKEKKLNETAEFLFFGSCVNNDYQKFKKEFIHWYFSKNFC